MENESYQEEQEVNFNSTKLNHKKKKSDFASIIFCGLYISKILGKSSCLHWLYESTKWEIP